MPRTVPQSALARRALVEKTVARPAWWQQGAAVLGVSVLGLGLVGAVALPSSAQRSSTSVPPASTSPSISQAPGVAVPKSFDRREASLSRAARRPALSAVTGDERAQALAAVSRQTQASARQRAARERQQSLEQAADAAVTKAKKLKKARAAERAERARAKKRAAEREADRASLPITGGYRVAARFGDTGSWSRYHTGIDFSAGMGTPIRAVAAGVVTHAGSGSAGWAGTYVTIRHADGRSTLYAHMSSASVAEGERVAAGDRVGAVGMTGRTFGPHVHFELYPSGAKVGDPYEASDPAGWMHGLGLRY